MALQRKKSIEIKIMFLLNLPKHICRNASLGLRSLGRASRNGIRLVLKLEFNPKNYTF
jgi:hypothetical protein